MGLQVHPIPCLQDNTAYLLRCTETGALAVVDPSEAEPVLAALAATSGTLTAILNTHHHLDHVGGNLALAAAFPGIPIYGHRSDQGRIPGLNQPLDADDPIGIGLQEARILHVPGHTLGAIAYAFADAVFTGDTLFGAGCGRIFEGTPAMMYHSLNVQLARLPAETRVFFGHEYTSQNLRFALAMEPGNAATLERQVQTEALRSRGELTTPSTMAEELATNPFLRCDAPELLRSLRRLRLEPETPEDVLMLLRRIKEQSF